MIVKVHKTPDGRKILAVCDNELIGKRFEEKNLQLDLSSDFYKGDEKNEKEVVELIKGSCLVNLVGKESVKLAIKLGIANRGNIISVKKIPHAQALIE